MSDPNGSGNNPTGPEADISGSGRSERGPARVNKEPPVIEGTAQEIGAGNEASLRAEDGSSKSRVGTGLVAGVSAAIVVALAFYAFDMVREDGAGSAALTALGNRVSAVETSSSDETASAKIETDRLSARLGAAEEKIEAAAQSPESAAAVVSRLDRIEAEANALKQSLGEAQTASEASQHKLDELSAHLPPPDIADQVMRLDAMLKALNTALDALAPKIDQMSDRVAALEAKKDEPGAAARAALGLALANLARASESAQPFKTELETVARFLPDEPELARLQPSAASGVPTEASLKDRFPALAQAVLDAERQANTNGLWERFVASTRKLVTVRRTGEVSGTTSEAVLARMEERLKVDDLPAALMEGEALKGPAAEAAASWIRDARARVAMTKLLRELSAHVAARLAPLPAGAKG